MVLGIEELKAQDKSVVSIIAGMKVTLLVSVRSPKRTRLLLEELGVIVKTGMNRKGTQLVLWRSTLKRYTCMFCLKKKSDAAVSCYSPQEMKCDEVIKLYSFKADDINFSDSRSFPDDEYTNPQNTLCIHHRNEEILQYILAYDHLSSNNLSLHHIRSLNPNLLFERMIPYHLIIIHNHIPQMNKKSC
ncbi:hypothetical protein Tco_0508524 [Tanacetum coccineum]